MSLHRGLLHCWLLSGLLSWNLRHSEQYTAQAQPTAANAEAILNGPVEPSMLSRPLKSQGAGPLNGDVLRAFDNYHQELAAAAGVEGYLLGIAVLRILVRHYWPISPTIAYVLVDSAVLQWCEGFGEDVSIVAST